MTTEDQSQKIGAILAKCWSDKAFKQKLLTNTAATLQEEGVQVPAGYTINVMENTSKTLNFVIPPNPNGELSDIELESVAGGKGGGFPGFPGMPRVPGLPSIPNIPGLPSMPSNPFSGW
jgi:hypothetical protein